MSAVDPDSTVSAEAISMSWVPAPSDYRQAFAARNRTWAARKGLVLMLGYLAFLVVSALLLGDAWFWGFVIGFGVFLCVAVLPNWVLGGRLAWKRQPALREPVDCVLSVSGGVTWNGTTTRLQFSWSRVGTALESPGLFVLLLSGYPTGIVPIPKRAMAPEQEQRVRAILTAQVPSGVKRVGL